MRTLNQVRRQDTAKLKRTFVPKTRKGNPIIYWPHLKEYNYRLQHNIVKVKVENKVHLGGHKTTQVKVEEKVHTEEEIPTATETICPDNPIQRIKIEEV